MEEEKVNEVFRRLNAGGVRYALIGGLAYAEYAPPRATEDMDVIVLVEDARKVRALFPGCYRRGTAIAEIYDFEGVKLDVQPARRRVQAAVVANVVDGAFHGEPVKVACLRDLIFLKIWAAQERKERLKREQDLVDAGDFLNHNPDKVTRSDIAWIAKNLLSMAYTPEEVTKYRGAVEWLNQMLDDLGMSDRKFTPPC